MLVSEMFYTLQGEGFYTGVPSVFIRTSGCNLRCHFCDTAYTSWWTEGTKKKVNSVIDEMYETWGFIKHIVITGGEPTIQKQLPILVDELEGKGHLVTIETNGTNFREDLRPSLFSISPKTSNSIPSVDKHPKDVESWEFERDLHIKNNDLSDLKKYVECGIQYQMKFVTVDDSDLTEIKEIIKET